MLWCSALGYFCSNILKCKWGFFIATTLVMKNKRKNNKSTYKMLFEKQALNGLLKIIGMEQI